MAKVIILNAPPRSGKDTIAKLLAVQFGAEPAMFKASMFKIVQAMIGDRNFVRFMEVYETDAKGTERLDFLGGKTCREMMIWVSEDVVKPVFGKRHFGNLSAESLENRPESLYVFSDGGFPDEIESLLDAGHQVNIFRLYRTGFDFSKDSRDYIHMNDRWGGGRLAEFGLRLVEGKPQIAVDDIGDFLGLNPPDWHDDIPW